MNNQSIIDNSITGVRSNQNMGFNWLGSTDFGRIVPFHVEELLETDHVSRLKPNFQVQMLNFASPTFGKMDLYCHYFFVPTRLIWDRWNDFHTKTGLGALSTPPYSTLSDFYKAYNTNTTAGEKRGLFKHWTSFGLPPFFVDSSYDESQSIDSNSDRITTLPFRAYQQIWWDFYRDPELIPDTQKQMYVYNGSGHDVYSYLNHYLPHRRTITDVWFSNLFASNGSDQNILGVDIASSSINPGLSVPDSGYGSIRFDVNSKLYLSTTSSLDATDKIGQFDSPDYRKVEALTRMAERLSLGGKRQIDRFFALYGVKPEYSKLSMCQYIGGAKSEIRVQDIISSSDTTQGYGSDNTIGSPLGWKGASGYCVLDDLDIDFTANEAGYLIGVFSVMPKLHFVQGIGKQWFRNSFDDWFRRELEHVSQVAVSKREVAAVYGNYLHSTTYNRANDNETFGFDQSYYEYKRHTDVLAGDFMWYHSSDKTQSQNEKDLAYMQSMGIWTDYPVDRLYNPENMSMHSGDANQVFWYQGGEIWDDADDHFHINIDVDCLINRPMDGYAVPTLETTENPHLKTAPLGQDVVL